MSLKRLFKRQIFWLSDLYSEFNWACPTKRYQNQIFVIFFSLNFVLTYFFAKTININEGRQEMSWSNWNFNQFCLLGLKYHYFYSKSRRHPESYIIEKLCLMKSLARFLLFLVYDNHFWPKNTVKICFSLKLKKITMNLSQYCNNDDLLPGHPKHQELEDFLGRSVKTRLGLQF